MGATSVGVGMAAGSYCSFFIGASLFTLHASSLFLSIMAWSDLLQRTELRSLLTETASFNAGKWLLRSSNACGKTRCLWVPRLPSGEHQQTSMVSPALCPPGYMQLKVRLPLC